MDIYKEIEKNDNRVGRLCTLKLKEKKTKT